MDEECNTQRNGKKDVKILWIIIEQHLSNDLKAFVLKVCSFGISHASYNCCSRKQSPKYTHLLPFHTEYIPTCYFLKRWKMQHQFIIHKKTLKSELDTKMLHMKMNFAWELRWKERLTN